MKTYMIGQITVVDRGDRWSASRTVNEKSTIRIDIPKEMFQTQEQLHHYIMSILLAAN